MTTFRVGFTGACGGGEVGRLKDLKITLQAAGKQVDLLFHPSVKLRGYPNLRRMISRDFMSVKSKIGKVGKRAADP